jgi:hypothetical protein
MPNCKNKKDDFDMDDTEEKIPGFNAIQFFWANNRSKKNDDKTRQMPDRIGSRREKKNRYGIDKEIDNTPSPF